jgi:hypothetical protein
MWVRSVFWHGFMPRRSYPTFFGENPAVSFAARNADSTWRRHGTWGRVYDCKQKVHIQTPWSIHTRDMLTCACRPVIMHEKPRHATPCCPLERAKSKELTQKVCWCQVASKMDSTYNSSLQLTTVCKSMERDSEPTAPSIPNYKAF